MKTEFGTLDALFVNAGINGFAPFEATTEQMYDEVLAVNAKGPYFTVQKLAPCWPRAAAWSSPPRSPTCWLFR